MIVEADTESIEIVVSSESSTEVAWGYLVSDTFAGWVLESDPKLLPLVVALTVAVNALIMFVIDKRGKQFQEKFRTTRLMQLSEERKPLITS